MLSLARSHISMAPSSRWLFLLLANPTSMSSFDSREGPVAAVATWEFGALAVAECVTHLLAPTTAPCSALDAVERGINRVELDNADQYHVGVGGLPNADGVMELDAAVMDHRRRYGAVLALTDVPTPVSVARSVLERSPHSVLCGAGARAWAASQGFDPVKDAALTEESRAAWETWRKQQHPAASSSSAAGKNVMKERMEGEHDTVGVICLDRRGRLACGTSTSGWAFKHPGRVGDSPIVGAGLYNDGQGAAVATGDGEEILRVGLSFLVVELMRGGKSPQDACAEGIRRLLEVVAGDDATDEDEGGDGGGGQSEPRRMHARLTVGVVAMNKRGEVGAASTLGPHNVHRGRPGFPVVCWRRRRATAGGDADANTKGKDGEVWRRLPNGEELHLVVAGEQGADF